MKTKVAVFTGDNSFASFTTEERAKHLVDTQKAIMVESTEERIEALTSAQHKELKKTPPKMILLTEPTHTEPDASSPGHMVFIKKTRHHIVDASGLDTVPVSTFTPNELGVPVFKKAFSACISDDFPLRLLLAGCENHVRKLNITDIIKAINANKNTSGRARGVLLVAPRALIADNEFGDSVEVVFSDWDVIELSAPRDKHFYTLETICNTTGLTDSQKKEAKDALSKIQEELMSKRGMSRARVNPIWFPGATAHDVAKIVWDFFLYKVRGESKADQFWDHTGQEILLHVVSTIMESNEYHYITFKDIYEYYHAALDTTTEIAFSLREHFKIGENALNVLLKEMNSMLCTPIISNMNTAFNDVCDYVDEIVSAGKRLYYSAEKKDDYMGLMMLGLLEISFNYQMKRRFINKKATKPCVITISHGPMPEKFSPNLHYIVVSACDYSRAAQEFKKLSDPQTGTREDLNIIMVDMSSNTTYYYAEDIIVPNLLRK